MTEGPDFAYTALVTAYSDWSWETDYVRDGVHLRFFKSYSSGATSHVIVSELHDNDWTYSYCLSQRWGDTFLITVSDSKQAIYYEGLSPTRVFKSVDEGETWAEVDHDLPDGVRIGWLDCCDGTWIAAIDDGIVISADGETWTRQDEGDGGEPMPDGFEFDSFSWRYIDQICMDEKGVIHVIAEDGNSVVYTRSEDLGLTWLEPQLVLSTDSWPLFICLAAMNDTVVVTHVDCSSSIWEPEWFWIDSNISIDNGDTWGTQGLFDSRTDFTLPPYWSEYNVEGTCLLMDKKSISILLSGYFYVPYGEPHPPGYEEIGHQYADVALVSALSGDGVLQWEQSGLLQPENEGGAEYACFGCVARDGGVARPWSFSQLVPVGRDHELDLVFRYPPYEGSWWLYELRANIVEGKSITYNRVWRDETSVPLPNSYYGWDFDYSIISWVDGHWDSAARWSSWPVVRGNYVYWW